MPTSPSLSSVQLPRKPVDDVIAACTEIVLTKKYSLHPFVSQLAELRPDKTALGRWALQKYHQVRLQNAIFSIIHAKTALRDVRQFMIEQLVAEETTFTCGSDAHYNLMGRFAVACGVDPDTLLQSHASEAVETYVNTLLSIMREEHFTVGLLTIYAIESQSSESVGKLMTVLRREYDFSLADLEWFAVHADEDDDHADEGLRLVKRYADLSDDFDVRAVHAVNRICEAWLKLHDFYAATLRQTAN
ncbi:iron-containing redox enzyme family protein [Burkholderia multivorans]|uniref:iron-containing redox enzyme family protein n=1 Tax=Burkholderia multivorans TaxID=87883 RepID=UPI0009BFD576|nr:iron-containing redox enzyme family protein [Burkholderia multivorans]